MMTAFYRRASSCRCSFYFTDCTICGARPATRLELIADQAGVDPDWLRGYLRAKLGWPLYVEAV